METENKANTECPNCGHKFYTDPKNFYDVYHCEGGDEQCSCNGVTCHSECLNCGEEAEEI